MAPRPAPDLDRRRHQIAGAARAIAESEGWAAVTMRRLASALGVTQPVLYSAFAGRQALVDAIALDGFEELAAALEAVEASARARMGAYLDFAATHPAIYEAMFTLPSTLGFATDAHEALSRAFSAIREALPGADETAAEVVWATLHGLVTLQTSGRLPPDRAEARMKQAHQLLTR